MLGSFSSTQPRFFCLDAMNEYVALDQTKILPSLQEVIKMFSATPVFLTGRSHIGGEVGKHPPRGITVVSISSRQYNIIPYIYTKFAENTTSDEMGEIRGRNCEEVLGNGLDVSILTKWEILLEPSADGYISRFLLVSQSLDAILQEI